LQPHSAGNVDAARAVLERGFSAHPDSEEIWLAAVKVETGCGEIARARALLERARSNDGGASSGRVWMKSGLLERFVGDMAAERGVLEAGVAAHPEYDKLWMMLGQLETRTAGGAPPTEAQSARALATFRRGLARCPGSAALWLCAARAEPDLARRRAILETAATALNQAAPGKEIDQDNDRDAVLAEAVRCEIADKNVRAAHTVLSRALRDHPHSGRLWSLDVELSARATRKAHCAEAAKKCPSDARVIVAIARHMWGTGKIERARAWLQRCVGGSNG
jgi:pre-mRNA-processing factor 6